MTLRQYFLSSVSICSIVHHKPFSKIFNDQCNLILSKSILVRTLNSRGSEFENISENEVLAKISESTVLRVSAK